jgi:3-hydroxyacyl-[acyl-carrier-protein] dehydratase
MVGFGGIDGVKFRGPVRPGDRLVIATQITKYRRGRLVVCRFQEFVGTTLVTVGEITGIPLPDNVLQASAAGS